MIKLLTIAIGIMLFAKVSNLCNDGCLQCSSGNTCLTCDSTKNYFLNNDSCIQKNLPNCLKASLSAKCLLCNMNYFVDGNTGGCVEVPTNGIISNCRYYSNPSVCSNCKTGFYLQDSKCVAVETKIDNCDIYASASTCMSCSDGYMLSASQLVCKQIPQLPNCQSYSQVDCDVCQADSLPESNSVLYSLVSIGMGNDFNSRSAIWANFTSSSIIVAENCTAIIVSNCSEFKSFKECLKCDYGYYVDSSGGCSPNPAETIPNCVIYKSLNVCQSCQQGFYLKTPSKCSEVESVDECEMYSTTADETVCTKCFDSNYLASFNLCDTRLIEVQYCSKYNPKADKCNTCFDGYSVTTDGLKCLTSINACKLYSSSNQSIKKLRCTNCVQGYYLNSNACLKGTQPNCRIYETAANRCVQCENRYYLTAEKVCAAHEEIEFCLTYDPVTKNRCVQCLNDSVPFKKSTECVEHSIIGCLSYLSNTTCGLCADRYDLNDKSTCHPIPSNSFCLRSVKGVCSKCKSNYILSENVCIENLISDTVYCTGSNINGSLDFGDVSCNTCSIFAYPYNYRDNFGCIQQSTMELVMQMPVVADCLNYTLDERGEFVCAKCENGKFLQNGSCVQKCLTEESLIRYHYYQDSIYDPLDDNTISFIHGTRDICAPGLNYCKIYYPIFDGESLKLKCVKCFDNTAQFFNLDVNTPVKSWGKDTQEQINPLYIQNMIDVSCMLPVNLDLISSDSASLEEFCSTYTVLPSGEHGCIKCRHGYYGLEVDYRVVNCKVYDSERKVCIECLNGYSLTDEYHCNLIPTITNCLRYSTKSPLRDCVRCVDGYYIGNTKKTCEVRTMTGCESPDISADLCVVCPTGTLLNTARDRCYQPITSCVKHRNVDAGGDVLCERCEEGYALNEDENTCTAVIEPECALFSTSNNPVCILYKDSTPFTATMTCTAANKPTDCLEVDRYGYCKLCNNSTYLTNGRCCSLNKYHDGTACVDIPTAENCDAYKPNSLSECLTCSTGNYLTISSGVCCPDDTYFDDPDCATNLDLSLNVKRCDIFDLITYRCVSCRANYYLLFHVCCPEGQYYNLDTRACTIIDYNDDCLQVLESDQDVCIKCSNTTKVTNGHCCEDDEYWEDTCQELPESCLDYSSKGCVVCATGYYKVEDTMVCCELGGYLDFKTESCKDIEDDYGVTNCDMLDQRIGGCTEATMGYSIFNDGLTTCQHGFLWTGSICAPVSLMYTGCKIQNTDNYCEECGTGIMQYGLCVPSGKYYDTTGEDLEDITLDNCVLQNGSDCAICNNGDPNLEISGNITCCQTKEVPTDTCFDITDTLEYCAIFDIVQFKCYAPRYSSSAYYQADTQAACEYGDYASADYTCTTISVTNCIKMMQLNAMNTRCLECSNGYYLNNYQCEVVSANCLFSDGTVPCTLCEVGYMIDNTDRTCTSFASYKTANTLTDDNMLKLENCLEPDTADLSDCRTCRPYHYYSGSKCCPNGYYTKNGECTRIPSNNPYCARYNESDGCDQCYSDLLRGISVDDNNFYYQFFEYGMSIIQYFSINLNSRPYYISYQLNLGYCCPLGQRFSVKAQVCIDITLENCIQMNNDTCLRCADEYLLSEDGKRCCRYNQLYDIDNMVCSDKPHTASCDSEYFRSNGHCCPERSYWDEILQRCIPLLDSSCFEASSPTSCDKCEPGHYLNKEIRIDYQLRPYGSPSELNYPPLEYTVAQCTPYNDNQYDAMEIEAKFTNCQVFDYKTLTCLKCESGYYSTVSKPYCIAQGSITIINTLTTIGTSTNCESFDFKKKECLRNNCASGYHYYKGFCCLIDKYYNESTGSCDSVPNCDQYDYLNNICLVCKSGYYFYESTCTEQGKYLDSSKIETAGTNALATCLEFVGEATCRICDSTTYLSHDQCCSIGKFLSTGACSDIDEITFGSCAKLDNDGNCIECKPSNYLYSGFCCLKGTAYNVNTCESFATYLSGDYDGCDYIENDNCMIETTCTVDGCKPTSTCDANAYLSNGECCVYGTYYDTVAAVCVVLRRYIIEGCDEIKEMVCEQCKSGLVLYTKQNICCPEGTYVDDGTLECVSGDVLNCKSYTYDVTAAKQVCTECLDALSRYQFFEDDSYAVLNHVECALNTADYPNYLLRNCDVFDISEATDNVKCSSCNDGTIITGVGCCGINAYYTVSSNSCKPSVCINFDNAKNQCLECAFGTYVSGANKLNCCADGTYFNETFAECMPILISNCLESLDNKTCLQCSDGNVLKKLGTCGTHAISNCADPVESLNANGEEICVTCSTGYYVTMIGIICQASTNTSTECQITDQSSDKCLQCKDINLYYLDQDECKLRLIDANCQFYSPTLDNCQECKTGFHLNTSNICTQSLISDCDAYDENGTCLKCAPTHYLSTGNCTAGTLADCDVFNTDSDDCVQCKNLFYLDTGNCTSLIFHIEGCIKYDQSLSGSATSVCKLCTSGYILSTDVSLGLTSINDVGAFCVLKISNCISHALVDENVSCSDCEDKYTLFGGKCVRETVINCKTYSDDGAYCLVCDEGYVTNFTSCITTPYVEGCSNMGANGLCTNCSAYYTYDATAASCTKKDLIEGCEIYNPTEYKCVKCQKGFYIDAAGSICTPVTRLEFCVAYSYNSDECTKCSKNHYLDHGECVPRTVTVSNCKKYTIDADTCAECTSNYYLSDSTTCTARTLVADCSKYNSATDVCLSCDKNYYFKNSKCNTYTFANIHKCRVKNPTENSCKICISSYYLNSGVCASRTLKTGCLAYTVNADTCTSCKEGYKLSSGGCVAAEKNVNCAQYDSATDVCTNCDADYILSNGYCIRRVKIPNCTKQDPDTNDCLECEIGATDIYQLQYGICFKISMTISDCTKYSTATNNLLPKCVECTSSKVPVFYETNDARNGTECVSNNCSITDAELNCIICSTGYILYNNYCIPDLRVGALATGTSLTEINTYLGGNTDPLCYTFIYIPLSSAYKCSLCDNKTSTPSLGTCVAGSVTNCYIYNNNTTDCEVCKAGYYFSSAGISPPVCTALTTGLWKSRTSSTTVIDYFCIGTLEYKIDCTGTQTLPDGCEIISKFDGSCIECNDISHYYNGTECLDRNNDCQTSSEYQTLSNHCSKCSDGKYLIYGNCCRTGHYVDPETGDCVKIDSDVDNRCLGLHRGFCAECLGSYPALYTPISGEESICCDYRTVHSDTGCIEAVEDGLEVCERFQSPSVCSLCADGYYITFDHCCKEGYYFDSSTRTCTEITVLGIHNCLRVVDDPNKCDVCDSSISDPYISNNSCCDEGTYWNGDSCVSTYYLIPNCSKISGGRCLSCYVISDTVESSLSSSDGLCCANIFGTGTHFDYELGKCVKNPLNCSDYDYLGQTCLSCKSYNEVSGSAPVAAVYYAAPKVCCPEDQYFNLTACVAITTLTNPNYHGACSRLHPADLSMCLKCTTGKVPVQNACVVSTLISTNCLEIDDNGNCTECSTGYVSNGVCCDSGKYFDPATSLVQCTDLTGDCIKNTGSVCTKCSGIKVLSMTNTCCTNGVDKNGNCFTGTAITNCAEYDVAICQKCVSGYIASNEGKICCADETRYDDDYDYCLPLVDYTANCEIFDVDQNICITCDTSYIKGDKFCCASGKYYEALSGGTPGCTDIDASINCSIYSNINGCVECSTGATQMYPSSGKCCEEGKYNVSNTCTDVPSTTGISGCLQYDGSKCLKCPTAKLNNYDGKCCDLNEYFDTVTSACIKTIDYCDIYDVSNHSNVVCERCDMGYKLSVDRRFCCEALDYGIFTTFRTCLSNPLPSAYKNCLEYDARQITCLKCNQGSYLSHGYCCEDGKYHDLSDNSCKSIASDYPDQVKTAHCKHIDAGSNRCLDCDTNYKLYSEVCCLYAATEREQEYQGRCHKNPLNCMYYDFTADKCLICYSGFYLSTSNVCVATGSLYNGVKALTIGTKYPNCEQVVDHSCIKCKDDYYVTQNNCCEFGKYLNKSSGCADGEVYSCIMYDKDGKDCIECDKGYFLVDLYDGVKYCHPIKFEDCIEADITESDKNYITCTRCDTHNQNFIFKPTEDVIYIDFRHPELDYYTCSRFIIDPLLSNTSFVCLLCSNNDTTYVDTNTGQCLTRQATNCAGEKPANSDTCNSCGDGYYLDTDYLCKLSIDNCKIGTKIESCQLCKTNYMVLYENSTKRCLKIETENEFKPDFYPAYVDNCEVNSDCSDATYAGLSAEISSLYSCHVCNDSSRIPFIGIRGGIDTSSLSLEGLQQFIFNNSNDPDSESDGYSSECFRLTYIASIVSEDFNFPPNCALGAINSNLPFSTQSSNDFSAPLDEKSIFCTACKPGYRPDINSSSFIVYQCSAIENCNMPGIRANGCEVCNVGYLPVQGHKGLNYGFCIQFADKNCFAVDQPDPSLARCTICKGGYSLNRDGVCEILTSGGCESFELFNSFRWSMYESIITLNKEQGCARCQSGSKGFYNIEDRMICTYSKYLESQSLSANTVFLPNCFIYQIILGAITCLECKPTFIVTVNGKCILTDSKLANCAKAITNDKCGECYATHVLVANACHEKIIGDCLIYVNNPSPAILTCARCAAGYYLSGNRCNQGKIRSCEIYKSAQLCDKCASGFAKTITKNNFELCMPVDIHPNCGAFDSGEYQQNSIVCRSCATSDFYVRTIATANTYVCNKLRKVENCTLYDNTSRHLTSTYKCLSCDKDYYLSNNTCIKRTVIVANCKDYESYSDSCSTCESEYYIGNKGLNCEFNPFGVPGCLVYADLNYCKQCASNLYLSENTCVSVPTKNLIPNCKLYYDETSCNECMHGYLNDKGLCRKILANNCLTYQSIDSCATCAPGYGFSMETGIKSCLQQPSFLNCSKVTENAPFSCERCIENHYPNEQGVCVFVIKMIDNCSYYSSGVLCSQCKKGYILTVGKDKCVAYSQDTLCENLTEDDNPFCALCKSGYKLNKAGECEAFRSGSALATCLVPNMVDDNSCLVCKSGYIQNSIGDCIGGIDTGDSGNSDMPILKLNILLLLLLALLNFY